jgi:DNA-binding CsgD family transcriptional regulator
MSLFVVMESGWATAIVNASPLGTAAFGAPMERSNAVFGPRRISAWLGRDLAWSVTLMSLQWPAPLDDRWVFSDRGHTDASIDISNVAASVALDTLSESILLVDRNRQIRLVNRQAQALVRKHDGLTDAGGRLGATSEPVCQLLGEHIRAVISAKVRPETRIMVIGSIELRNRLLLKIKSAVIPKLALIIATTYDQRRAVVFDQLRAPFGLTRAEAALATEMLMGRSVRDAAQTLGVSYNTARCHLSRVFEKVGVRRQPELILTLQHFVG